LRDLRARARIEVRPGDVRPVGEGVSELRIDYGPGYGLYYLMHGQTIVILLCGGDKRTQAKDIEMAELMAGELRD
jgi:putative addiction module killer protein